MKPFLNKTLFILLLCFSFIFALSQEPPFKVQRMLTDFRGIVTNGKKTICYGDYGIMTYSTDAGKTWEQDNWGDKYNIMRIESDGIEFYGVTDYFMFRTYNNDSYWHTNTMFDEPKIIDMTLKGDTIFILTKAGILLSDKEMNIAPSILTLDSESTYQELKTDGINLYFISDNRLLMIYNLVNHKLDTVDLIHEINCIKCTNISGIKVFNNKIYALVNQPFSKTPFYKSSLVCSENQGKTWKELTNQIYNATCYKIINDEIYFLRPMAKLDSSGDNYFLNNYFNIDSSQYTVDSTYETRINILDTVPKRYIKYDDYSCYSDFVIINNDTIIAAGPNKLISVSYNSGKSFEFKSFFNCKFYAGDYYNIYFLSDSIIYVVRGYSFYKTTDGGITWLPQNYKDYNFRDSRGTIKYLFPKIFYFDPNGRGFAKYDTINRSDDSSALVTEDFGDDFYKTNDINLMHSFDYSYYKYGLDLGDAFLFFVNAMEYDNYYDILRFDKSFNFLDSINMNYNRLIQVSKLKDGSIITLNLKTSGENIADSSGKTINYLYSYFLLKSSDYGKSWDSVNVNVPIPQILRKNYNSDDYSYYDKNYKSNLVYENFILYPTSDKIMYKYDYINNKFDSIFYPANFYFNDKYALIFKYHSKLFMISFQGNNKIYFTSDISSFNPKWDSVEPGYIFGQWENFQQDFEGKDAIISSYMYSDSTGFLVIGKSLRHGPGWDYKLNFAKIISNPLVNIDEQKIETKKANLWNSPPYPIPGTYIIQSKIYWKNNLNIEDTKINIYDINGEKIYSITKLVQETANYGILTWNTENINSGIYMIQILIGRESLSIPVIINK
ncbi:MAG: T9SS type A sorting domain-containing protein [Ignavibacteriae bacterium]|nr:T9SS type A sorting domain-containing protein [Ignavibacteriota bacterium]